LKPHRPKRYIEELQDARPSMIGQHSLDASARLNVNCLRDCEGKAVPKSHQFFALSLARRAQTDWSGIEYRFHFVS
jgi:hypothetical protein